MKFQPHLTFTEPSLDRYVCEDLLTFYVFIYIPTSRMVYSFLQIHKQNYAHQR